MSTKRKRAYASIGARSDVRANGQVPCSVMDQGLGVMEWKWMVGVGSRNGSQRFFGERSVDSWPCPVGGLVSDEDGDSCDKVVLLEPAVSVSSTASQWLVCRY